ncbi:MAG: hypothetical protein OXC46_00815 [Thaumarchaeota archaeon]|nr:hypothetical protein [Nitrososphaerota archaeon]
MVKTQSVSSKSDRIMTSGAENFHAQVERQYQENVTLFCSLLRDFATPTRDLETMFESLLTMQEMRD